MTDELDHILDEAIKPKLKKDLLAYIQRLVDERVNEEMDEHWRVYH